MTGSDQVSGGTLFIPDLLRNIISELEALKNAEQVLQGFEITRTRLRLTECLSVPCIVR